MPPRLVSSLQLVGVHYIELEKYMRNNLISGMYWVLHEGACWNLEFYTNYQTG